MYAVGQGGTAIEQGSVLGMPGVLLTQTGPLPLMASSAPLALLPTCGVLVTYQKPLCCLSHEGFPCPVRETSTTIQCTNEVDRRTTNLQKAPDSISLAAWGHRFLTGTSLSVATHWYLPSIQIFSLGLNPLIPLSLGQGSCGSRTGAGYRTFTVGPGSLSSEN